MSSMLIHPITQITNVAHQIAHLNFSEKCDVDSNDEIGNMAESINTMSDFMQAHIAQLEEANEQLHRDIALQKAQDEARKNLVSNLSHDLKTPIGLISGYADGLRSGMAKTESEVREYCDVICDEADRMNTLILHMMELFRLESGTVELELEEFDLSDLLNYLVEIFTIEIERANIQFTQEYDTCLYIRSDYFSVEQVLTNYMQNAVSHMSEGRELRLQVADQGSCYRVSIFNSAAPIPQEELSKIWDSFYRLDKSRSRGRRESGLGLSIVRSNMELLGGAYGVENVPGGVVFWAEFQKSL
jgi:signal transduction histidine kinase